LDVNNAFLYGELDEEVYITLLLEFICSTPNKVSRLYKSLYGLRQAPANGALSCPPCFISMVSHIHMLTILSLLFKKGISLWYYL